MLACLFWNFHMALKKHLSWQRICWLSTCLFFVFCCADVFADEKVQSLDLGREAPLLVISARPFLSLTERFKRSDGWTGADAAWTIPISEKRTSWFFGDTWIGKIRDNKHVDATIINNTVALQSLPFASAEKVPKIDFYWRNEMEGGKEKAASFFPSDSKEKWFWPGAGASVDGRIFLILHRIKKVAAKEPDFGFAEDGSVLAQISNPQDDPLAWKVDYTALPDFEQKVQFGNACLLDGDYFYCYCTYRPARAGVNQHPLILARHGKGSLLQAKTNSWEFLCDLKERGKRWRTLPESGSGSKVEPVIMFADGAPEMSVSKVPGIPGYVAVYIAAFEPYILLRHAAHLEGPWSRPVKIYKCPEDRKKLFVYAAKAHPELAKDAGELVLTYCRNTKFFADQVNHSDWYAPQAVRVLLRVKRR